LAREKIYTRLIQFIAFLGISQRDFAKSCGFSTGYLNSLKNGTEPGTGKMFKILSSYPQLNKQWLLSGEGEMLMKDTGPRVAEVAPRYELPESDDMVSIPIADIKAAAGGGYQNSHELMSGDFIQLPPTLTKSGKHLCIRIKGNSMSPTLQDGGFVVIRFIDKGDWRNIINERVYVITDNEGNTYLKRVRNRFTNGFLVLTSDNPDKATYPNFNLQQNELLNIWYVEWYLSAKMPNIHDQFYSKLERLENNIDDLNRKFEELTRLELKTKK
jgi:phage repressor protein C with HTH and peptisase S24 domain